MAGVGLAISAGQALAAPTDWTACRISQGVLVVPAQAAGLTGAFVLDTATSRSVLDSTQASLASFDPAAVSADAPVRVAGLRLAHVEMSIAALDARTSIQPTPITGVLGADVLAGRVLEVEPDPCRFRIGARGRLDGRVLARLPMRMIDGAPYVPAKVSDGAHSVAGAMRVATGMGPVSLDPAAARMEGAPAGASGLTAPLRALSLGPLLVEGSDAAVASDSHPGVLGEIGEPVWARYGFQLDLKRGVLTLFKPQTKEPARLAPAGPNR
jgi:hypothetical protein